MSDIIIRKANSNDIDQLFGLVEKFATSYKANHEAFTISFENLFNDMSVFLYVVECNEELIGYCLGFDHYTFFANGRVSWLEEIMILESYRKSGIGRKLMDEFEKWAKSRNSGLVALATRRAAPFYKALDYEESAVYFRKLLK
ncbi:GNAT family N-acetyltransferase [Clostridium sp.]|uniref:GNAT family N-acetyltransferase n=1 Tax=Clostridium sp. TaxID=1506 RepID=UPI002639DC0C|nr:GNAT family N-acetyltransferase [Clostridium sp.]